MRLDDLDHALGAYLEGEVTAPVPRDRLDRALAATRQRRPRPLPIAWLREARWLAAPRIEPSMRLLLIGVALVLLLAGVGMVGRIGPGPVDVSPSPSASPSSAPSASRVVNLPIADGEPWIVYMSNIAAGDTDRVFLVRPDGSDRHQVITSLDGQQEHPDWSPDGSRIAFDHWIPDQLVAGYNVLDVWTMRPDGTALTRVAACELPCYQLAYPAWSPDGTQIAMIRFEALTDAGWGKSAIEVVTLATGERRTILESADGTVGYWTPRWSPDGQQIVFGLETYTDAFEETLVSASIAVVDVVGGEPRVITPADLDAWEPDWHPSGDRIVFRTRFDGADPASRPTATDLYTIRLDGTGLINITNFALGDLRAIEPTWTPDGDRIVFTLIDGFGSGQIPAIALIDADGSDMTRLGFGTGTVGRLRPTP